MVAPNLAVNLWRTGLLAVVALAMGAYIALVERPRMEKEAAPDPVLSFDPQEIASVELRYPGQDRIRIERRDDAWHLVEPLDFPADPTTVTRLLQQVADAKSERRIDITDAEPLATYGLAGDGEQARVSLTKKDGRPLPDLVIGRTTPVGYNAFARVEGKDEIIVTPLLLHTGVRKSVTELRDKRLFDLDPTDVIALTLKRGGTDIRIERKGDEWALVEPIQTRADADQVRALLSALSSLQATAFHDEPVPGDDGAEVPQLTALLELAGGATAGFRLGRPVGDPGSGYYLRRLVDGLMVTVDDSVFVRFDKDPSSLRDKRLFPCGDKEIAEVRFERADGKGFALLRRDGGWRVEPSSEDDVLREKIAERTATGLGTLAGNDVVTEGELAAADLAVYGLDAPTVEVEVKDADGGACGKASAGVVDGESETPAYYVRREEDGLIMTLPSYLYSRLDVRRDDLVSKPEPSPEAAEPQS